MADLRARAGIDPVFAGLEQQHAAVANLLAHDVDEGWPG